MIGAVSVDLASEELIPTLKVMLTDDSTQPEILHNILTLAKVMAAKGRGEAFGKNLPIKKQAQKPMTLDSVLK